MSDKKPYVGNGETLCFQNKKGYVCDNEKFGELRVARYSKCFEDGFVGDALTETTIRYDIGLCISSDSVHGSSSWYLDRCIGKDGAMMYATALLSA